VERTLLSAAFDFDLDSDLAFDLDLDSDFEVGIFGSTADRLSNYQITKSPNYKSP